MSKSIFHRSRRGFSSDSGAPAALNAEVLSGDRLAYTGGDESPAVPLGAAAVLLTAGAALVLTRKRQTV